jgi:hypothetical protein
MASLPFLLFTVTTIKIDWTMRVKAFLNEPGVNNLKHIRVIKLNNFL